MVVRIIAMINRKQLGIMPCLPKSNSNCALKESQFRAMRNSQDAASENQPNMLSSAAVNTAKMSRLSEGRPHGTHHVTLLEREALEIDNFSSNSDIFYQS